MRRGRDVEESRGVEGGEMSMLVWRFGNGIIVLFGVLAGRKSVLEALAE